MDIKDFLSPENIVLDFGAVGKAQLLAALSGKAASALDLPRDFVAQCVSDRDELGSTGIGGGVAIPHARFRELNRPFAVVARLKEPIDFEAIDGEPVDLVFLLLLPASAQLDQLNALAAVARKLRSADTVRRLRAARSSEQAFQILVE